MSQTVHTFSHIKRRRTCQVKVGELTIGSNAPVIIQSMTNTDTADVLATVMQVRELVQSGSELVRITVNNEEAAKAVSQIKEKLQALNVDVPLVGDFHYNGHLLMQKYPDCVQALAKLRINPGNVGHGKRRDTQFATIIEQACQYDKPVRIGVNWGSLDQSMLIRVMDENQKKASPLPNSAVMREALICSAIESAEQAQSYGLAEDHIILSAKVSNVQDLILVYQDLAKRCHYPLHLGLTEAGMGSKGIVASTAALSVLLQQGIGDTIRISLTPEPNGSRSQEVIVAQEILQTMGLRAFLPMVTACPGCGRTTSTFFQELASAVQEYVREQMPMWRTQYLGVEQLTLAVMGCIVNGPGESRQANIGISLPGTGESPAAPVYMDGEKVMTLRGENIAQQFIQVIGQYVNTKYLRRQ